MTKEEMKDRISMALKDLVLQQGFEIICKNLAELEKEKCELLGIIQGKDKVIQELKKELNNMLVSKNQQLTKAKEIIKDYLTIVKGSHTTVCGVPEENSTIYVLKLNKEAEQFLNGEVEKLIESPVDHIIEQNEKEVSLNPDYFSGGW